MKISQRKLKQIIKEEISRALKEQEGGDPFDEIDAPELLAAELQSAKLPRWFVNSWLKAGSPVPGKIRYNTWYNRRRAYDYHHMMKKRKTTKKR